MTSLRALLVMVAGVVVVAGQTTDYVVPVLNMSTPGGFPVPTDTMSNRARVTGSAVTQAVVDAIRSSCIFARDNLFLRRLAYSETTDGISPATFTTYKHGGIWNVDQVMFQKTQANSLALSQKYEAIRQHFGIDWLSVRWEDLEKPLYSGLAAALYISTQPGVPMSSEDQGTYLHNYYNPRDSPHNYTTNVNHNNIPNACDGTEHADVIFLLDVTTSDDDFERVRQYVRSVTQGVNWGVNNVRVAVYQFWGSSLTRSFNFNTYPDKASVLSAIQTLPRVSQSHAMPDTGAVLEKALGDFRYDRPNAAKIVVIVTDGIASNLADSAAAAQAAERGGVSIFTVGVGGHHSHQALMTLSTEPKCTHHLMVDRFQELKDIVQLTQHLLCAEPMIAQGMVHCALRECRNVAFPVTSNVMTVITNVTCEDGSVYVSTRHPSPGRGFADFRGYVRAGEEPTYVTVAKETGGFIYAAFQGNRSSSACVATISTVNGVIDTTQKCKEWEYPLTNPCLDPARGKMDKFQYFPNDNMFIQCDLQNNMYLTRCPPNAPYYSPDCHYCVGPDSPALANCGTPTETSGPSAYCGLPGNPCTRDNLAGGRFYFACPGDETKYLQCNPWGHGYVRSCQQNFVWREVALTCEYERPGLQNPCQPGTMFYPYPQDPHYYIQCNDLVPNLMHCQLDFVWDAADDTCVPPSWSTVAVTHVTYHVTAAATTPAPPGGITGGVVTPAPNGLLSNNYAPPCTQEATAAMQLFHPYPGHPDQYIQCDPWGDAWVKSCQAGFNYNPLSHTCVNGPVTQGENAPIG